MAAVTNLEAAIGRLVLVSAQLEQTLATVHALQFDTLLEEQRRQAASRLTSDLRKKKPVHAKVPDVVRTWAGEAQALLDRRNEVVHSVSTRVFDARTRSYLEQRLSARDGREVVSDRATLTELADEIDGLVTQGLDDVLKQVAAAQGLHRVAQGRSDVVFVGGIPGGFEVRDDGGLDATR